jgi:hypothetical protein
LFGFTSSAITWAWGNQLGKQLQPLRVQLEAENAEARQLAPRPGETGDQAGRDRVVAAEEDDRDRRGCAFRRGYPSGAARHNHVDLPADEIGG